MLMLVAHRGFLTPLSFGGLHTHCECVLLINSFVPPAGRSQERGIFLACPSGAKYRDTNPGEPCTVSSFTMSSACISATPACGRISGGGGPPGVVGEYRPDSFSNASQNDETRIILAQR
jgi:hypothetical protein